MAVVEVRDDAFMLVVLSFVDGGAIEAESFTAPDSVQPPRAHLAKTLRMMAASYEADIVSEPPR